MNSKKRKVLQPSKSVMVAISHAANRCDELLKGTTVSETEVDVNTIKNTCAILREWTTDEGNVLPTMYFNDKLSECNEPILIAGVNSKEYYFGYTPIRKCV